MIAFLMADGFEDVEALCPYDLLKRAGFDVRFIAAGECTVRGKSCGSLVSCTATANELLASGESIEMLVLPGGMPRAANLDCAPVTDRIIERTEKGGGFLAAICAAPMVYGKRGLLRGKHATVFPGFEKYLDGALLSGDAVVRDGRFITAAGMGAAFPFGVELIRALAGDAKADEVRASVCAQR